MNPALIAERRTDTHERHVSTLKMPNDSIVAGYGPFLRAVAPMVYAAWRQA